MVVSEFFRGLGSGVYTVGLGVVICLAIWLVVFCLVALGGIMSLDAYSRDLGKWFNWSIRIGAILGALVSGARSTNDSSGFYMGRLFAAVPAAVAAYYVCWLWAKGWRPWRF
jgi:hypothetical protein